MKTYTIFWLTGQTQLVTGKSPHEAMNAAGIGLGALPAMDFYAEGDQRESWQWDTQNRTWIRAIKA